MLGNNYNVYAYLVVSNTVSHDCFMTARGIEMALKEWKWGIVGDGYEVIIVPKVYYSWSLFVIVTMGSNYAAKALGLKILLSVGMLMSN